MKITLLFTDLTKNLERVITYLVLNSLIVIWVAIMTIVINK